jgi:hypothetical protein
MARVLRRITTDNSSTLRGSSATFPLLPEGRENRLRSSNSERVPQEAGTGPVNPSSPPCPPEKKSGKMRLARTSASVDRSAGSGSSDVETDDPVREGTEGVGYGKPPRHSRFKPGQSGNPKGRAKNIKNFANILKEELETLVEVTENGRRRKLSKGRLAIKGLVLKAVKGDHRAVSEIFRQMEKHFKPPSEMLQTSPGTSDEEASAMSPMRHLILDYFAPHNIEERRGQPAEANQPGVQKEAK